MYIHMTLTLHRHRQGIRILAESISKGTFVDEQRSWTLTFNSMFPCWQGEMPKKKASKVPLSLYCSCC